MTHKELYPAQYRHPLVGQRVRYMDGQAGTVERVVASRFGPLAIIAEVGPETAYAVSACRPLADECPPDCTNHDMGTCPRCYQNSNGLGCAHGPLCAECQADITTIECGTCFRFVAADLMVCPKCGANPHDIHAS